MMRYRMLSASGDYTFGQGLADFSIHSPQRAAQSVQTRLGLWQGEWFLDNTVGTPYATQILGYNTKALYDMAIKAVVLGTNGVTSIESYDSEWNAETRKLTVTMDINTAYSKTPIPVPPVVI